MTPYGLSQGLVAGLATAFLAVGIAGCHNLPEIPDAGDPVPLAKVTPVPEDLIVPGHIVHLQATQVIPIPPYRVEPLDVLYLTIRNSEQSRSPVGGLYGVEADGTIDLGPGLGGTVAVAHLFTEDVHRAVQNRMQQVVKDSDVAVTLAQPRAAREIDGDHVVRMDGTVNLGRFGDVKIAGLSAAQAKIEIERHLSRFLYRPEVTVDDSGARSSR